MAGVGLIKAEKVYSNGFRAVGELDLEIIKGEFMVLSGPSGCGESTILRMISGLEEVTRGEIRIGDKVVNNLNPKEREISMISQNHGLYPHMTIYENMAFPLKVNGVSKEKIEERVKKTSERLGIDKVLKKKPREVTGEERQLAAIGKALVRRPKVLLFDEPLSNLDVKLRESVRAKISKIHRELKEGGEVVTVVYATQDHLEAVKLGGRVCLLDRGRVVQVDSPSNLYHHPVNKFAAEFISFSPMNLIEARLGKGEDRMTVETGKDKLYLSERMGEKAGNYIGKQVWFGIRPEDVGIRDINSDPGENFLRCKISMVSMAGREGYIYFTMEDNHLISRGPLKNNCSKV